MKNLFEKFYKSENSDSSKETHNENKATLEDIKQHSILSGTKEEETTDYVTQKTEEISFQDLEKRVEKLNSTFADESSLDQIPKFQVKLNSGKIQVEFSYANSDQTIKYVQELSKTFNKTLELYSYYGSEINLRSKSSAILNKDDSDEFEISLGRERFSKLSSSDIFQDFIYKKKGTLSYQELDILFELYKEGNLSLIQKEESSLEDKLSDYGAQVYISNQTHTWDSLAGYDSIKGEVKTSIILPYMHPKIFNKVAKNTRTNYESNRSSAVLFEGPPGTGKTSLSRIIANEISVPLVYLPIESIMSKWYGEAEKNLANIFDICTEYEHGSILFLDEIDSLGGSRENSNIHEATRRILSTLLRKMDGFNENSKVLVLGATNRKGDLDSALLSRFDLTLNVPYPNGSEREKIFSYYAKQLSSEDLTKLGKITGEYSGRNIKDICEHAERKYATDIIQSELTYNNETPTVDYYLDAIKLRD